jgi:hypothetical protein
MLKRILLVLLLLLPVSVSAQRARFIFEVDSLPTSCQTRGQVVVNRADNRLYKCNGHPGTYIPILDSTAVQATSFNSCSDAGSTDAYACSLSPAITSYTTGGTVWFKAATANTGAATLNLNSLGAKTIKKQKDQDLADNDIKAGQWVALSYDGTNFQMLSPVSNAGGVASTRAINTTSPITGGGDLSTDRTIACATCTTDTNTQTMTNKTLTSPVINTPTGIVKGDVGLGNVDNTSDATKNSASATLTNKTISGASNTLTVRLASDVTGILPAANGGAGTVNGILKANGSGTVSQATSGTDYAPATSGSSVLKGNGSGGFSNAASGTDYAPATSGSSILKGNGSGGFSNASAGTDYQAAGNYEATLSIQGNGSGVGNVSTGETDLFTYAMPGATLSADNKAVRLNIFGTFANNGNSKTVKVYFGSTVIGTPASSSTSTGTWFALCTVIRTSATTQVGWCRTGQNNGASETANLGTVTTPAETMSGSITIKVTGQSGTASNDVLAKGFIVTLLN